MPFTYGRECKLGWGYDESLKRLIPIEGSPPDFESEVFKNTCPNHYQFTLSCAYLPEWERARGCTALLEPSYKRFLDFSIVFDDKEYWERYCWIGKKYNTSGRHLKEYPLGCKYFINQINYGVKLWMIFPKTGFPEDSSEVYNLFHNNALNEVQRKVKCRVLINYNEAKEMTLEELTEFVEDIRKEKYPDLDTSINFSYENLDEKFREIKINNAYEFRNFLSYLYIVYRKIEMKMEKARCEQILQELDSNEKSSIMISAKLVKAKEDFRSTDRNDFLKMYPVLKKLFFCYIDYINCSIEYGSDIDEGDFLPGNIDEIKSWLLSLNKWFPIKVNGEWRNCTGRFIGTPKGFENVIERLQKTTRFKDYPVFDNKEVSEPYICIEENDKSTFGFIDMETPTTSEIPEDSKLFEWECPKGCSRDLRRWVCTICGDFVFQKELILYCSCGSRRYSHKSLICHHPSHGSPLRGEKTQETAHSQDSSTGENGQKVINTNLLSSICQQLQKVRIKKGAETDSKILIALVDLLSNTKKNEEIRDILKELQGIEALNGDTQHLISQYLDRTS